MLTQSGPTMAHSRGERSLCFTINKFFTNSDKKIQEISFNKLTKNKPNFYQFSNVFPRTKDSMISLIQGVYKSFPNRTSHQRHSSINLPPLIPYVSLTWSPTQNMKNETLYSAQVPRNCATICTHRAMILRLYTNPSPSFHDFTLENFVPWNA